MPKLIAKVQFRYGGRQVEPGEEFEANDRDARTLKAIGKAQAAPDVAEPPSPAPRRHYRTAAVEPGPAEPMTTDGAPTPARRRRYGRRDMSAES